MRVEMQREICLEDDLSIKPYVAKGKVVDGLFPVGLWCDNGMMAYLSITSGLDSYYEDQFPDLCDDW